MVTLTHILIVDNEILVLNINLLFTCYLYSYANQRWIFNTQRALYNKFLLGKFIECGFGKKRW